MESTAVVTLRTRLPLLLTILVSLSGCTLFNSKEQNCLESSRLEFKDPDSLKVVANLGTRGQVNNLGKPFFWLRYKATNSYGAFTSSNMACAKVEGKWVRDTGLESGAIRTKFIALLGDAARKLEDSNRDGSAAKRGTKVDPDEIIAAAKAKAVDLVMESLEPIGANP